MTVPATAASTSAQGVATDRQAGALATIAITTTGASFREVRPTSPKAHTQSLLTPQRITATFRFRRVPTVLLCYGNMNPRPEASRTIRSRRQGIASAHFTCPSKPSDVAIAR
jgi:hypothetical protein